MIICLCRGVSDRSVRLAVEQGARTLKEVAMACGAGRGCGGCHEAVRELIGQTPVRACADCAVGEVRVASAAVR